MRIYACWIPGQSQKFVRRCENLQGLCPPFRYRCVLDNSGCGWSLGTREPKLRGSANTGSKRHGSLLHWFIATEANLAPRVSLGIGATDGLCHWPAAQEYEKEPQTSYWTLRLKPQCGGAVSRVTFQLDRRSYFQTYVDRGES